MKRILLTGASGFIGSHAIAPLLARGYEVHTVSRTLPSARSDGVIAHAADLLDCGGHRALMEIVRPTHLLHAAWYVEHQRYWEAVENVAWLKATLSLAEEFIAAGGKRFVGVGTCAEYKWGPSTLVEGKTEDAPNTLYGSAKLASYRFAAALTEARGVEMAWARIFFPYGAGETNKRLIPHVIASLLDGKAARCTAGTQTRDFLHVDDVGDALAAIVDSDIGGLINVGSGVAVPIKDVALQIGALLARPDLIELGALPQAANSPDAIVADVSRLNKEVRWYPRLSLNEGLTLAVDYWREKSKEKRIEEGLQP